MMQKIKPLGEFYRPPVSACWFVAKPGVRAARAFDVLRDEVATARRLVVSSSPLAVGVSRGSRTIRCARTSPSRSFAGPRPERPATTARARLRAEEAVPGGGDGKPGALLLDLDGTLVDSAPDLAGALNQLRAEQGLSALALDEVKAMVGDGVAKLVERGLPPAAATADPDRLVGRYVELYHARQTALTRPFPGVVETLRALNTAGWRLAVCTNKPEAASREILAAFGLDGLFAAVGGGDSFAERKPAAGHLLATLARMAAEPSSAVMVGDSPNDVLSARKAGLPVIVVGYGYSRVPPAELGADALIERFAELPAALAALAAAGLR
jgi:phosphoglycolate phosphatase